MIESPIVSIPAPFGTCVVVLLVATPDPAERFGCEVLVAGMEDDDPGPVGKMAVTEDCEPTDAPATSPDRPARQTNALAVISEPTSHPRRLGRGSDQDRARRSIPPSAP